MSYFVAAATYAQSSPHSHRHLVLVELGFVVVLGVVVLVDVVVWLETCLSATCMIVVRGHILSDWSQTRLAGMDLAKSSIDWNSSSERSTADC